MRKCRILGMRLVSLAYYLELFRISSQKCDIKNFCSLPIYLIYVFHLFISIHCDLLLNMIVTSLIV